MAPIFRFRSQVGNSWELLGVFFVAALTLRFKALFLALRPFGRRFTAAADQLDQGEISSCQSINNVRARHIGIDL